MEIKLQNNRKIVIGELYRQPNSSYNDFIVKYESLIEKIDAEKADLILGTDQNLNFLNIETCNLASGFLETNLSAGIVPHILKPTRITHDKATLIDNIYTKSNRVCSSKSAILATPLGDHCPCLLLLDELPVRNDKPMKIKTRKLDENAISNINNDLSQKDWDFLESVNVNDGYTQFIDIINNSLDERAPEITKTIKPSHILKVPWMTSGLLKSSITCDKLYKKSIGYNKAHPRHVKYTEFRNSFNRTKRLAKVTYYKEKLDEFRKNTKQLWKTLNTLIGKTNDKTSLPDMFIINGKEESNGSTITNEFCKYFTTVGSKGHVSLSPLYSPSFFTS